MGSSDVLILIAVLLRLKFGFSYTVQCKVMSVVFSLFLQPSQLAIELVAVNLRVSAGPPELFLLEVQPRDGGDFALVQVYALDPQSGCPEYTAQGVPCSGYEGELGDIPPTVIVCPVNFAGVCICMYVCCMHVCMLYMYVCMYVCMLVYVLCMYVCMYVCISVAIPRLSVGFAEGLGTRLVSRLWEMLHQHM